MGLTDLLCEEKRRSVIVGAWMNGILDTYPKQTAGILKSGKDRFSNPVGVILKEETGPLYDQIVGEADPEKMGAGLDKIIRIRAVQDFSASTAVSFVFLLKDEIRKSLKPEIKAGRVSLHELLDLEAKIDRVALQAFEVYMGCREKLYELRVMEFKNQTYRLLQRANLIVSEEER